MARSRNIKPGFFKNEHLSVLPPLTRLLFQALWCEADREGRLEERPARLSAEYFPYDAPGEPGVSTMLAQLENSAGNFIVRYTDGNSRYIQIVNFIKHQNPHQKEAASTIPTVAQCTIKCVENKESDASTIPASCKHRACLMLAGLIPDSLLLIPDSLIGEKRERFTPPSPEEVQAYMDEIGFEESGEKFCNHYASKGWMIGKNKMKDWRAAVRTWRGKQPKSSAQGYVLPDFLKGVK